MAFQQARARPQLRTVAASDAHAPPVVVAPPREASAGEAFLINAPLTQPTPTSPTSTSSSLSSASVGWTKLNLSHQIERPTARGASLSSSSSADGLSSPTLGQTSASVLPQHNGQGRFFRQGSHIDSATDAVTSSEDDVARRGLAWATRPRNRSLPSESSSNWSPASASRQLSPALVHQPLPFSHWATTSLASSRASEALTATELGDSWALTEEALAAVPDGSSGLLLSLGRAARPASRASAALTDSDVPEDDVDGSDDANEPWAASAGMSSALRRRRLARSTPTSQIDRASHTKSHSSRSWASTPGGRAAYPSPPPDDVLATAGTKAIKRRHRQAGKGARSQKRSSNGGSVAGSTQARARARQAALAPALAAVDAKSQAQAQAGAESGTTLLDAQSFAAERIVREQQRRQAAAAASGLFLGGWAARLTRCDVETLELFADADGDSYIARADLEFYRGGRSDDPTPTQSRASSPRRANRGLVAGGFAALSRYAQEELGEVASAFHREIDDDDSGAETEREDDGVRSVKTYRPPSPALSATGAGPSRSLSARSLPAYLTQAHALKLTPTRARSISTSSAEGRVKPERRGSARADEGSPWGGEIEGREAALSYWRRILRRMRGF